MSAALATTPSETPRHESFDIGVKALIVKNRRLLLLKRKDYQVWEMPGGRINQGETAKSTLLRELSEELPGAGPFNVKHIVHAQQTEFTLPNNNRLMLLFFEVTGHLPRHFQLSSEHESFMWVSAAGLARLKLQPQVLQAAHLILETDEHDDGAQ